MICPHCSQWNLDEVRRCTFCDNVFDGEDRTAGGEPAYRRTTQTALPEVQRGLLDEPGPREHPLVKLLRWLTR